MRTGILIAAFLGLVTPTAEPSRTPTASRTPSTSPKISPATSKRAIRRGPGDTNKIALTLDDGVNWNPPLLDHLERENLKGTAFLVGNFVADNQSFVDRLVAMGWEICPHSQTHERLTGLSSSKLEYEVRKGAELVEAATGQRCPWFRPPYGSQNARVVAMARKYEMAMVNWDTSLSDSTSARTPASTQIKIALNDLKSGSIVLGHFGGVHTLEVLQAVVSKAREEGFSIGTVSALMGSSLPWQEQPIEVFIRPQEPLPPLAQPKQESRTARGALAFGALSTLALIIAGVSGRKKTQ